MNASTEVPMTVTPEAEARIAELGMQKEFEQMIAHIRAVVPGLITIEVVREPPYDEDWEPISITAYSDQAFVPGSSVSRDMSRWEVDRFHHKCWSR